MPLCDLPATEIVASVDFATVEINGPELDAAVDKLKDIIARARAARVWSRVIGGDPTADMARRYVDDLLDAILGPEAGPVARGADAAEHPELAIVDAAGFGVAG